MKVLVVEDDQVSQKLTVKVLEKNNYEVFTVETGKDAVKFLETGEEQIDIVISDIMMPVMDGFNLLSYMKADIRLRRIPVILCTALNDINSVKRALTLGAVDYVTKPIDANTLLAKVRNAEKRVPGAVLVVDDEDLLRGLLSKIIMRDGLKVLQASSGKEALELLDKNNITVVLSDIVMPEMNGLELLVEVKEKNPTMPVVLVTGHGSEYSKDDILAAGADGFISKPFKNAEIISRIRPYFK